MARLKWFLDKLRIPEYVDRVSDDPVVPEEEEEIDSIVPQAPQQPQDPANRPLNNQALDDMANQMWGEGFDTLQNPEGAVRPGVEQFPMSNKLRYNAKMRRKTEEQDLEPLPPLMGGAYG